VPLLQRWTPGRPSLAHGRHGPQSRAAPLLLLPSSNVNRHHGTKPEISISNPARRAFLRVRARAGELVPLAWAPCLLPARTLPLPSGFLPFSSPATPALPWIPSSSPTWPPSSPHRRPPSTPLHVQRLKRTPVAPEIQAAMEGSRTLSPWPPIVLLLSPGVLDAWCFDLDSFPCERHLCSAPSPGSELPLLGPSLVQPAGRVPLRGRERGPPSTPLPQRQYLQHPPCFLHRLSSSLASWLASLLLAHSLAVRSSTSTARHLFDAMPSRVVVRSTTPCSSRALPSAPAMSCLRTIRQNARMSIVSWTMPWWCPTSSLLVARPRLALAYSPSSSSSSAPRARPRQGQATPSSTPKFFGETSLFRVPDFVK
jgi:hypothetical protein